MSAMRPETGSNRKTCKIQFGLLTWRQVFNLPPCLKGSAAPSYDPGMEVPHLSPKRQRGVSARSPDGKRGSGDGWGVRKVINPTTFILLNKRSCANPKPPLLADLECGENRRFGIFFSASQKKKNRKWRFSPHSKSA